MTVPIPPDPIGCRVGTRDHRISDPESTAAAKTADARAELAARLRVPLGEVDVLPDRTPVPGRPSWVRIRAQWVPPWRRP